MSRAAASEGELIAPGVITLFLAAIMPAGLVAWAYWPGLMTWDSVRQYSEALSGDMDDWHPPVMQWIWRQAIAIHPGPAPMLLLQLALYWGGLTLLAAAALRRQRRPLALAILACGLCPLGLALTGMVLKDSLMAGALLVATGAIAQRLERGGAAWAVVAAAMILFASTLRFNAFAACLPLTVAVLPRSWRRGHSRLLLTSGIATLGLMVAMPLASRLIGAKPSGVELSLVIFDLGGITEHSGVNVFPDYLEVRDPVSVNHGCYRPDKWDSYSDWVDPECPLGYTAWNDNVDPAELNSYAFWAGEILLHPIAYGEHRLTHFAVSTRILPLPDNIERPVPENGAPNSWGFYVTPNPVKRAIDALAMAMAHTPIGWPIFWMGAALGALIASWGLSSARLVAPLGLSSLFYGSSYLVFGVAAELRYHLWTELAALLAITLVLGEACTLGRRRLIWSFAPLAGAVLTGIICRVAVA